LLSTEAQSLPAAALPPLAERLIIRCAKCHLVQYLGTRSRCPRCLAALVVPAPEPPPPEPDAPPNVAVGVRCWRRVRGLTQKQLAFASHLPRTYVSRIENGRIVPGLLTLERVAIALEVGLSTLLVAASRNGNGNGNGDRNNGNGHGKGNGNGHGYPISQSAIRATIYHEPHACLKELLRYSGLLSGGQRRQVLIRVRELAAPRLAMSH
jgi:transcriptional regulator with XRE-family HTH domain